MSWANLYLYHPRLFVYASVMFLSLSLCISLDPSFYHPSTVLTTWRFVSFGPVKVLMLIIEENVACVRGTSVPRQKLTMGCGPISSSTPSFQCLVSDGVSCTCLTIWTALGMGKGWPDLIMFMYRAGNQYVKYYCHRLVMLILYSFLLQIT